MKLDLWAKGQCSFYEKVLWEVAKCHPPFPLLPPPEFPSLSLQLSHKIYKNLDNFGTERGGNLSLHQNMLQTLTIDRYTFATFNTSSSPLPWWSNFFEEENLARHVKRMRMACYVDAYIICYSVCDMLNRLMK